MRKSSILTLAIPVCCLVLVLSSCSGDDGEPGARPDGAPSEAGEGRETPEPLPGATASPTEPVFEDESNVLDVAIREPSTLDPMRLQDPGSVLIARQLYEGLTRWDPGTQQVQPAVAESWKTSKDARTFTFKLRPDARFSDGTEVTSEDFRFAFDRIALKKNGSDLAYLLELVRGFDAVNAFGDAKRLTGVKTPDPRTLVIQLSEPYVNFPTVLTHPSLVPLKEDSLENIDRFLAKPLGNGPFQMAQPFEIGQPVLLEANEASADPPDLEGIRFLTFADPAASWIPFTNGEIDIAEVPTGRIDEAAEEFGEDGYRPLLVGSYYGFNLRSPQLRNKSVRRAVNYAIDRDAIIEDIYQGTLTAPRGVLPLGMPGFEDDACGDLCERDLAQAKRIVGKLPKRRRELDLQYTREQPQGRVARAVKRDLEEAGFEVSTKSHAFPRYLRILRDNEQDVFRLGWISEYPDPDAFLSALFDSSSPDNHTELSSAKVDELLARARRERSDAKRLRLYQRAERIVIDSVPLAPLGSFVSHWAAQPSVEGLEFDVLGGFDAGGILLESEE
ncbi:MAG: peptide ABC transporter substrate-binding protein [Actinomycetota bacterium]